MKPKPTSSMQRATAVRGRGRCRTPSASSTSAEPAQAGRGAVAVLGDGAARAGGDQGGGGRDVEGRPAAAGAGGVDEVRRAWARTGVASARIVVRQPGELVARSRPWCAARSGSAAICTSDALPRHDLGEHGGGLLGATGPGATRARRSRSVRTSVGIVLAREEVLEQSACPCRVSTDSGWNWTPSAGSSRWRMRHHDAAAAGGDLEAVGQVLRCDDQRVVAPDGQRVRQPGEDRPAVVLDRASSCRGPARGGRPCRRRPGASDWWPRQTPSIGTPASGKRRTTSSEMPASFGRARPGRDDDAVGAARQQLVDGRARRCARPRAPRPARPGTGRGCR